MADTRKSEEVSIRSGSHACVHFVGFRDDRYWSAVKVWGIPAFFHLGWDMRARREIADGDTVVFADGPADQLPRPRNFSDIMDVDERREMR